MNQEDKHESDRRAQETMDRCSKCSTNSSCLKYQDILFVIEHEDADVFGADGQWDAY